MSIGSFLERDGVKRVAVSTEDLLNSKWLQDLTCDDYRLICSLLNAIVFEYYLPCKRLRIIAAPNDSCIKPGVTTKNYRLLIRENQLIYPDDMPKFKYMCRKLAKGELQVVTELRIKMRDNVYCWCKISIKCIYTEAGEPIKFVGKIDNIDLQQKEIERFKDEARRDPMTLFYNKIFIEKIINEYLTEQCGDRGAFIVVDIDNFKMINDTYGHLFGDKVLIEVAAILAKSFRNDDLIGRIGGDEFVILMKHADSLSDIANKARKICEELRGICSDSKNNMHRISGSLGIARYPQDGRIFSELFERADQALYATKGFRKNDFTICGTEEKRNNYPINNNVAMQRLDRFFLPNMNDSQANVNLIRLFELLFDNADINQGIQQVIELVGNHYMLDRVSIITREKNEWQLDYEWCRFGVVSRFDQNLSVTALGDEKQDVFVYSSDQECQLTDRDRKFLLAGKVKSVLQYGLRENGKINGNIIFEVCKESRSWVEAEIESLLIVSKFIGSFLGKIHNQKDIEKLAYTDRLTGMWNFNKFLLSAENSLQALRYGSMQKYAVICFDIKKFRYVNDTFGFDIGDDILMNLAKQLNSLNNDKMMFARMGADKFVILIEYTNNEQLQQTMGNIVSKAQYFISARTGKYKLIFCFGVYIIENKSTESVNAMVDKADMARNRAHNGHKNNYVYYNDEFRRKLMEEKEIEDLVDAALACKEFVVYYQPKIELLTGQIKGAEALVRWRSPIKGLMLPAQFIPLFEKNGVITKMDFYVFELVFANLRRWLDAGMTLVPISINLSRMHLSDNSFLEKLLLLSAKYKISPRFIEIELTESAFMDDINNVITVLHELKKLGFDLSIDDFGSGYSSLRLLRDLPVDYLKLDKDFLDKGDSNLREKVIIRHVIQMAKSMGIKVVSEGVETIEQAAFLKGCACDLAQGYLYARPMPVDQFEEKLWDFQQ